MAPSGPAWASFSRRTPRTSASPPARTCISSACSRRTPVSARRVEPRRAETGVLLEHALEIHVLAGGEADVLGVLLEKLAHAGPDGAIPEEPDAYLVHCGALRSRGEITTPAGAADAAHRPRSLAR